MAGIPPGFCAVVVDSVSEPAPYPKHCTGISVLTSPNHRRLPAAYRHSTKLKTGPKRRASTSGWGQREDVPGAPSPAGQFRGWSSALEDRAWGARASEPPGSLPHGPSASSLPSAPRDPLPRKVCLQPPVSGCFGNLLRQGLPVLLSYGLCCPSQLRASRDREVLAWSSSPSPRAPAAGQSGGCSEVVSDNNLGHLCRGLCAGRRTKKHTLSRL